MAKRTKIIILIIAIIIIIITSVYFFTGNYSQKDYSQLISNDEYQVFLFESPIFFPLSFASHPWFVVNDKGEISRWEIGYRFPDLYSKAGCEYVYKNWKPLFQGIGFLPYSLGNIYTKSKLIGKIEGEEAKKMIDFIYNSQNIYTYCNEYHLSGPNSNTYIQWILNNFPESGLKLPSNAFGKNFK